MKTRLASIGLVALLLMACGQTPANNGNDNPNDPGNNPGTQPGTGTEYTDVFFKTVETDAPYNVIVGTTSLSFSDGQVSGELSAYPDSASFPNDTGTLSGTYQDGAPQGDKQSYTANLTLDFENAPDYTASGSVYTVAGKIFSEQPLELNKGGSRVGKFILAEQD